jgi:hypothetical protein
MCKVNFIIQLHTPYINSFETWSHHKFSVFFPQEPDNGYILRDESSKILTVGSTVKFKCRLGYILHGSDTSICQENGLWSHDNTTCAGKYHTQLTGIPS